MKISYCKQLSDEWWNARNGKMTASNAQAIGNNGKGLETYIYQVVASKYSKKEESYINKDLDRGHELEEYARDIYELETGNKVEEVGFVEMNEYILCSPDGLIGEDGGIEIKSPNNVNHFKMLLDKKIDTKYLWQIQMCLYVTGRKWWDFVSYNPNFEKSLLIIRIEPDQEMQEKMKEGLKTGEEKIKEMVKRFEK